MKKISLIGIFIITCTNLFSQEEFKPSGYLGIEYRVKGEAEHQNDKLSNNDTWARGINNFSRLQTILGIQATKKLGFEIRIRDFNNLERNDGSRINTRQGTETRLRVTYRHNPKLSSRFQYQDLLNNDQKFEYQLRYNYYYNKDAFLEKILIAPKVGYIYSNNGIEDDTYLGANIEYAGNLFYGIKWDGTLYLNEHYYNNKKTKNYDHSKEFITVLEFYLHKYFTLYETDKYSLNLNIRGGYDPYTFREYKRYQIRPPFKRLDNNSYSAFVTLNTVFEYLITESLIGKVGTGIEYRNWSNEWENSAKNWRWQPYAFVGMRVIF